MAYNITFCIVYELKVAQYCNKAQYEEVWHNNLRIFCIGLSQMSA